MWKEISVTFRIGKLKLSMLENDGKAIFLSCKQGRVPLTPLARWTLPVHREAMTKSAPAPKAASGI
jgi:hypothetical protein